MPSMPVTRWEITAKDLRRLAAFYTGLFGWHVELLDGGAYAAVRTGLFDGSLVQSDPPASDVILYAQVPDAQEVVDRAVRNGGRVVCPVTETPHSGTLAYIQDPEGACWGLIQSE